MSQLNETSLAYNSEYWMWYRPETYDLEIMREVLQRRVYKAVSIDPHDRVLDIGGNIGAAARYFTAYGASVVSYEPDPASFELLRRNVEGFAVEVIEAAVTPSNLLTEFYRSPGRNQACNSTQAKRGYEMFFVKSYTLSDVLARAQPSVVKCDIEGAEFDLPWFDLRDFPRVREVIMEVHLGRKSWRERGLPRVLNDVEKAGFTLRSPRPPRSNASFNRLLHWTRS